MSPAYKLLLLFSLAILAPFVSAEKPFMKYPIAITMERKSLDDTKSGHKNLQFLISIANTHGVIDLMDLKLTLLIVGTYDGSPNILLKDRRQHKVLDRMLLNYQSKISLPSASEIHVESEILKSGIGDPNHINHGVWYDGYIVAVQDKEGNIVAHAASENRLRERFKDLKKTPSNRDFLKKRGLHLK
jgi:hypothetical protein